ncbi:MAG: 3-methyl-2-oxobutanoate hydroxymethyltransferase [Candidatus Yanofskybacteria bacterium]|nr:3-methyl-2-oxobutanoate hydroxymethyltransferase [Candidatus Yanofskybacteria bacterium]
MSSGIPLTQDRITLPLLNKMKRDKKVISALSIYDASHARLFDRAGGEVIIVGDSANMVINGEPSTKSMTMDQMIYHAKAVRNGTRRLFVVDDMPLGSYEPSNQVAIENAARFMRESDGNAVKIETNRAYLERVEAVSNFCPVVIHIGLNPNKAEMLGGYKTYGKTLEGVKELCQVALDGERAGACMILLESVTEEVSQKIRDIVDIPVLGIAAGRELDGQLLISYDLLGLYEWPGNKKPKHFIAYQADEKGLTVAGLTLNAYLWYVNAVKKNKDEFPGEENVHFLPRKTPKELEEREEILEYLKTLK